LQAGLGVTIRLFGDSARAHLDVAPELRLARSSATRTNVAGATESQASFAPVLALLVEGSLPLSPALAAVVGVGGELPFGQTTITINGDAAGELPRFAIVGDVGARWRF
ncbi:MAG: hypothetical protein ACHREM_33035, partial [Polyangiales bacterium]